MAEHSEDFVMVEKSVVGGLTANVKRWRGRASAERLKRQRWRKRALAAEAEVERLREALRAAGLAPSVVAAIAEGEPPRPCPAGHGDQCCGYPAACEASLTGSSEVHRG